MKLYARVGLHALQPNQIKRPENPAHSSPSFCCSHSPLARNSAEPSIDLIVEIIIISFDCWWCSTCGWSASSSIRSGWGPFGVSKPEVAESTRLLQCLREHVVLSNVVVRDGTTGVHHRFFKVCPGDVRNEVIIILSFFHRRWVVRTFSLSLDVLSN